MRHTLIFLLLLLALLPAASPLMAETGHDLVWSNKYPEALVQYTKEIAANPTADGYCNRAWLTLLLRH